MSNPDQHFRSRVSELSIPPSSDLRKDQALRLALAASRGPQRATADSRSFLPLAWKSAAVAGLAVAVIPVILHLRRDSAPPVAAAKPCAVSLDVWNEIGLLFPDRVNAVIGHGDDLDLRLSDAPVGGSADQVVQVACESNRHRCTIVTYSGQEVAIELDGLTLQITPLIDGDGSVIVLAGNQVIPPNGAFASDELRITATPLAKR